MLGGRAVEGVIFRGYNTISQTMNSCQPEGWWGFFILNAAIKTEIPAIYFHS